MRLSALLTLLLTLLLGDLFAQQLPTPSSDMSKEEYEQFINNHPFKTRPRLTPEQIKKIDKRDRPDLAWEQDFLRTMDPATGKPERGRLYQYMASVSGGASPGLAPGASTANQWTERGPNNIGGRTRALMWDPNSSNKVWAGGITGGLWYNTNITSSSTSWTKVNDFWDNIAVTAIAHDPNDNDTMYVGTGEGWGTGASIGGGIWKSTDGGSTWNLLSSTTTGTSEMFYVNDLIVRDESGSSVIYAAVSRMYYNGQYHGDQGLFRSTNHGTSWSQVLPNVSGAPYAAADIELDAGGRIWVGTRRNSFNNGGGVILRSDNGTTWTTSYTATGGRRVELATAPSDQNYIYAMISGLSGGSNVLLEMKQTTNRGASWTTRNEPNDADLGIPATDFTRGQAWYDLILQVDPNDRRTVIAGGIDLFRSTNGTISWTQISKWSNNANLNTLSCPRVHADQHQILFKPGASDTVIFGNDGGVYYSDNLSGAATSSTAISSRNKEYNVTQFYAGALHPTAGNNHMIAGAQDNGTIRISSAGVGAGTEVRGGDGAFCFIDQTQPQYQIASYVFNTYYRSSNGGASTFTTQLIRDLNTGAFINPADYDDNQNVLYSARNTSSIQRVKSVTGSFTDDVLSASIGSMASALKVSPHTTSSTTLFAGTDGGRVYKITGAQGASPTTTRLDPSGFPNGSVSCVQVGGSEDTLLATFFNYGVNSVWYTTNGGTSWTNKDNSSLADMPIRWALFNPYIRGEVILATEIGVWTCPDINAASPAWSRSNNGLANVRVDMLQARTSDSTVMAATYGRGVFTGKFDTGTPPSAAFIGTPTTICVGDTVVFTDNSTAGPTSRQWTFTGGTPSTSTASPVSVVYNSAGSNNVRLISSNSNGSDTLTQVNYINVNANPSVSLSSFTAVCSNSGNLTLSGGSPTGGTYSGVGVSSGSFDPSTAGAGTFAISYLVTNGSGCSDSASQNIVVNASPSVSLSAITAVCVTNPPFALTGGSPSGGTYTGTGVSGGTFTPATAGVGTHPITYTVTNSNSCTDSAAQNASVFSGSGPVSISAPDSMCTNEAAITLTATISGGSFSGTGVSGSTFNPSTAGAGTHVISYSLVTSCGTSSGTDTIVVSNGTSASLSSFAAVCEGATAFALSGGSPTGGIYQVNGTTTTSFDPGTVGSGTQTISYILTNSNGCSDTARQNQVVHAVPSVSWPQVGPYCANDPVVALSGGTPSGGNYSGTGVSSNNFDPSSAGAGSHVLFYSVTDSNSCSANASQNVTVNPLGGAALTSFAPICENEAAFTITGGTPTGGSYLVNGVLATSFDPGASGTGSQSISYVFTTTLGCTDTSTQLITVNAAPIVTLGTFNNQCAGNNAFTLSGGSPTPGNYFINGVVGTSFNPNSLGAGTYTIKYDYVNGSSCRDSAFSTITVLAQPVVTLSPIADVCLNDPILALGGASPSGGGFSGVGVSGTNFDPASAGVATHPITYTFTDSNSCTDSVQQNLTVKPLPIIRALQDTGICLGDTASFTVGGGITYVWSPASSMDNATSTAPKAFPTSTTTYYVTGTTLNSCSNFDSILVEVNTPPTISAASAQVICDGQITSLSASGGATYSWSPATGLSSATSASPTVNVSSGITYFLLGTDTNSCVGTDSVRVDVNPTPSVNAGVDTAVCDGQPYIMMGSGASTYSWSPTAGLSSPTSPNSQLTVTTSQMYSLIGSNSFGCSDTDAVMITQLSSPTVVMNNISERCIDAGVFTLNQGNPSGGQYSGPGVSGSLMDPSSAGAGAHSIVYSFTDANGCANTASQTAVVNALPVVRIDGLQAVYCENDGAVPFVLTPLSGGTLTGSGVIGSSFVPNNVTVGDYVISHSYTDTNGCFNSYTQNVKVAEVPEAPELIGFRFVFKNTSYNYQVIPVNGSIYTWKITNGTLIASANNVASVLWGTKKEGAITLIQNSIDGCVDSSETTIFIGAVSVDEANIEDRLKVYPNPADDFLNVEYEFSGSEDISMEILDVNGRLIWTSDLLNDGGKYEKQIDLRNYPAGAYMFRLKGAAQPYQKRFIRR